MEVSEERKAAKSERGGRMKSPGALTTTKSKRLKRNEGRGK